MKKLAGILRMCWVIKLSAFLGTIYAGFMKGKTMKVSLLFSDVKDFLSDEVNRVFTGVVLLAILTCACQYRTERYLAAIEKRNMNAQHTILSEIKKNRDKVHFRYFNLTRTLEEIHKVRIDTGNGRIEK